MCVCVCRYSQLVPSLQVLQFAAAAGLSRVMIILGLMKPELHGRMVSEELLQRQVGHMGHDSTQHSTSQRRQEHSKGYSTAQHYKGSSIAQQRIKYSTAKDRV